jgi:hypothetical protein
MPLVVGSLVLVTAARWLGILDPAITPQPSNLLPGVWQHAFVLIRHFNWHQWQSWLFLYLALSLGAELAPSQTDLRYGLPTLLVLVAGIWLFFFGLHHARHLHSYELLLLAATTRALWRIGGVLGLALTATTMAALVTLVPGMLVRALRRH